MAVVSFGYLAIVSAVELVVGSAETVVYVFDLLASGGSQSASVSVRLDSGGRVLAWARLLSPGSWAAATLAWLGLAGAAAWAATSRSREA